MAASAIAMFKSAKSRAFCSNVLCCAAPTICAMLFQWPGGVSVPAPSAQKLAIVLCSSVRVEPTFAPSAFTSARSATHFTLSSGRGGPGGRNCELLVMAKGATNPHCGSKYAANAGGVGTQSPVQQPDGGGTTASEPSPAREASI